MWSPIDFRLRESATANSTSQRKLYEAGLGITIDGVNVAPNWPYGYGCPYGSVKPTRKCKFSATDTLPTVDTAPPCYKASEALGHAQTAAFVSIVIVQWADLLICKTR